MMSFVYPKNHEMKYNFLLGSATLLFLLTLGQMVSFLLKNPERSIALEKREEGSVAVELVVGNQEQGIYYFPAEKRVEEFLTAVGQDSGDGNKTPLADGMSVRIFPNHVKQIDEMAPQKKLALGIPVDINQLSQEEIMLIPGIGEKTAAAIHHYISDNGCIRDMSELANIRGIKDRKIANMRKYLITKPERCRQSTSPHI